MQRSNTFPQKASAEVQTDDQFATDAVQPELRASVEQEIQGKVDTNHPDATPEGLTLIAEEKRAAREHEIERTHERWDRRPDSDREARCRRVAAEGSEQRREAFAERAASVDPWADPERGDPREALSADELAAVNRRADDIAADIPGFSRAAVSRRLAERVANGSDLAGAVVRTHDEFRTEPGQVIPIAAVGEVSRGEVDVKGEVVTLWEPSHPSIQQVGLIEDESGRIKFTSWRRSQQPMVRVGERVRFRAVKRNWYRGRCSVALTYDSRIVFPERQS